MAVTRAGEGSRVMPIATSFESSREAALAGLWAHSLGRAEVGPDDDFLELGGDSLSAVLLIADIQTIFGVALSPTAPFDEAPTVRRMAELIRSPAAGSRGAVDGPQPHSEDGAELLPAQAGSWFLNALAGGERADNAVVALRLRGVLDVDALGRALDQLVVRHEALRATYPAGDDGRPTVVVRPAGPGGLRIEEVTDIDAAQRRVGEVVGRRFDLSSGPVFEACLMKIAQEDHVFALVAHHLVMDDWSRGVLRNELAALYEAGVAGFPSPFAAPALGAPRLAARRARRLADGELAEHLEYWRAALDPVPAPIELPAMRRRAAVPDLEGALVRVELDGSLRDRLAEVARTQRATMFMVLLAGFVALLRHVSGATDIVVGVPTAGRTDAGSEGVVGLLANQLAVRVDASGDPSFIELLGRVRTACLMAYAHQDAPFERVVEQLRIERRANRRPLTSISFQLRNLPPVVDRIGQSVVETLDVHPGTAVNDLAVEATDRGDGLELTFEYPTALLDEADVDALADRFEVTLRGAMTDPDAPIFGSTTAAASVPSAPLVDTPALEVPDGCVHDWISQRAVAAPDAVAVVAGNESLTYRDLDERSNQLAHHLVANGVTSGRSVGILLDRDATAPVSLLAVLKAGGAFVPLDLEHPSARLEVVVDTARFVAVITTNARRDQLAATGVPLVLVDGDAAAIRARPTAAPARTAGRDDLAYVMFTSGSTGRPKGVMIDHGALAGFFVAFSDRMGLRGDDRVLASTALTFDPSLRELLLPLALGGSVVVAPRVLALDAPGAARLVASTGVTVVQGTPTTLRILLDAGWDGRGEVTIWSCGERLSSSLAAQLGAEASAVWNLYGPTEATQCATAQLVERTDREIPIGTPLAGVSVTVVDDALAPVPVGVVGELVIGGRGVSRAGYLGEPGDAFVTTAAGRCYRTGDLVRRNAAGTLHFVGRRDTQVKVRGVRIELGEIEAALSALDGVRNAVADVRDDRIVAWVVCETGSARSPDELRRSSAARLPSGLVPVAVQLVDRLPTTTSGKVDRAALADPIVADGNEPGTGTPPATATEMALAEIWASVLPVDGPISREDDFFALGGHSLLVIELVHDVAERFGVQLRLAQLFETPTLAELARMIDRVVG